VPTPGHGIILWGAPPIPEVVFQFPLVPDFLFPCIPIPDLSNCPQPPVTDGLITAGGAPDPNGSPDACDLDLSIARCSNGNYPVWDPSSSQVRCDVLDEDISLHMTECQQEIDDDQSDQLSQLEDDRSCCPTTQNLVSRIRRFFKRAASCPIPVMNPDYPNNKPANGICHSTFTCDAARWPNVCANARSAVSERGKTAVLTFTAGIDRHDTRPYYMGKGWIAEGDGGKSSGWALARKYSSMFFRPVANSVCL